MYHIFLFFSLNCMLIFITLIFCTIYFIIHLFVGFVSYSFYYYIQYFCSISFGNIFEWIFVFHFFVVALIALNWFHYRIQFGVNPFFLFTECLFFSPLLCWPKNVFVVQHFLFVKITCFSLPVISQLAMYSLCRCWTVN